MSSHKRRHKDRHSVSPDETDYKVSKKKHRHKDDLDYHNLKRNRVDDAYERDYSVERDSRREKGDYSDENNKHEKTKKSKLHKNYEEQYYRSKNTHSECNLNDKKKKKDYSKSNSNHKLDDRNSRTKEDASDDDEYHASRSNVKDRNFDFNSYNQKMKTYDKYYGDYEKFDRNSRRNELASDDGYDSSRNRERERSWKDDRNHEKENTRSSYASIRRDNLRGRTTTNDVKERSRNVGNNSLESNTDSQQKDNKEADVSEVNKPPVKKKMGISGAYIPPAKLRLMQQEITDKGSIEYQKIAWEALKKSINGLTNKINTSNIAEIVKELFKENIIRGRGVLCRAVMQAQALSPTFTHVYAALVAVINTKFPEISELLLKRLTLQFKRGFRRNDKLACLSSVRFMAHLLNQQVAHEILILEILTLLLENPTDHSVEVAIALLKDCGQRLNEISRKGANAIKDRLRHVLHECSLDVRTQYMLEVMFAVMKDKYKDYPSVIPELDLVEEGDKFTHFITLDEAVDAEEILNVFQFDGNYEENEERYRALVKEILGESDSEESGDSEAGESGSEEENDDESGENQEIVDMTETNLVVLRRNIYLTIQSSLDFEECAHKLLKMELKPGEVMEMCYMILDCCAQQRTYEKFYGLLAQRFCQLNKMYSEPFMEIFRNSYDTIHRLETNKLRNVAKFFAHLLYTDAIHWNVLSNIRLNENDTTSSSRIFIKILFQELCEYMGLPLLNARVKDVTLQEAFDGLFPRDNPHNTRFAINFFTSIGLGGLTDELREHLKNVPKTPLVSASEKSLEIVSEDSASSSSSSTSSSSSSSTSSSSDSDSDEPRKKSKKRQKINLKNEKPSRKRSTKKKKRS